MKEIIKKLKQEHIGRIEENVSLKKLTTYKVGGLVKCLVYPKDISKLIRLLEIIKNANINYKVLGNGSNLIFSDSGYDGILIKLSEFNNVEIIGTKIRVGAGFSLMKLSHLAAKNSLTGLEFAAGIPGTVGGALFMNAGAYKSDMGYIVKTVKVLTPDYRIIEMENKEIGFHYRTSFFKKHPDYICLETVIKHNRGNRIAIEELMRDRLKRRLDSQPLEYPSAGSVFRNPKDLFAGELIEKLNLKGYKKGGAMISDKHANFIINYKNATSSDIKYLIDLVQKEVKKKYNVDLVLEQEIVD